MLRQAQQINTQCGPYRHLENLHLVGGGGGRGQKCWDFLRFLIQISIVVIFLTELIVQIAESSETLQSEHLHLPVAPSFIDITLLMLHDAASPSANWLLQLLEESTNLKKVIGTNLN